MRLELCWLPPMNDAQQSTGSQDGLAEHSRASLQCRRWRRLHFSTWLVAATALAILTLLVVPGGVNNHDAFTAAPLFYEHGWPFVFLDRYTPPFEIPAGPNGLAPARHARHADPELRQFLKDARDKEGLCRVGAGRASGISEDGFLHVGPPWLDEINWSFRGEEYVVSWLGLALDLAVAFAIVAAVTIASEWWARRRRRHLLRCLLGAGLFVTAALAWWWLSLKQSDRESRAVAALRDKGFEVNWCCDAPVWLDILVGANHLRPFHQVVAVWRITDETDHRQPDPRPIVDTDVEHIDECSHLQSLFLNHTRITDAGLEHIKGLNELDVLELDSTQVTDAGLMHIHDLPRLRFLTLDGTRIRGDGLRYLRALPHLQDLSLDNTQITDDALPHLKALPELQDLSLDGTKVTDAGVPHLKALTRLKIVRLNGTRVTDGGLRFFEGALQLEKLELNGTKVTDNGVKRLRRALPSCTIKWEGEWEPPTADER